MMLKIMLSMLEQEIIKPRAILMYITAIYQDQVSVAQAGQWQAIWDCLILAP